MDCTFKKRKIMMDILRRMGKDCDYAAFEIEVLKATKSGTAFAFFRRYHKEVFGCEPTQQKVKSKTYTTLAGKLRSAGMEADTRTTEEIMNSSMSVQNTVAEEEISDHKEATHKLEIPTHKNVIQTIAKKEPKLPEPEEVVNVLKKTLDEDDDRIDPREAYESFAKVLFITQRIGIDRMRRYVDLVSNFLEVK